MMKDKKHGEICMKRIDNEHRGEEDAEIAMAARALGAHKRKISITVRRLITIRVPARSLRARDDARGPARETRREVGLRRAAWAGTGAGAAREQRQPARGNNITCPETRMI